MPTSGPGSKTRGGAQRAAGLRGFTVLELLIVMAIVAISVGVVSLALRDSAEARLEEEAARLGALFEMARAEARASGAVVHWAPVALLQDDGAQFRFIGLPASQTLPTRWLDSATQGEIVGAAAVVLGPEAILPPQRVVLRLAHRQLELRSDGLAPFAAGAATAVTP